MKAFYWISRAEKFVEIVDVEKPILKIKVSGKKEAREIAKKYKAEAWNF